MKQIKSIALVVMLLCVGLSARTLGQPQQVHVQSKEQKLLRKGVYAFAGSVQAKADTSLHLLASNAILDTNEHTLELHGSDEQPVKLETNDVVVYARHLFLDTQDQTGSADGVVLQLDEGYFTAGHAHKTGPVSWDLFGVQFTPCDSHIPHWSFRAKKVSMHNRYVVKARAPRFYINALPLFGLPWMYMPLAGRSRSGFMLPRFRVDERYGFGIRQEYYKYFSDHADMTIGVDWRANRGLVFSDEWRWGRAPGQKTYVNARAGWVQDEVTQKQGKIFSTDLWRYAVVGYDFRAYQLQDTLDHVRSLARIDISSDKRFDYQFFSTIKEVDDSFYNTLLLRGCTQHHQLSAKLEHVRTVRRQFSSQPGAQMRPCVCCTWPYTLRRKNIVCKAQPGQSFELHEKAYTTYLPHVEVAGLYHQLMSHLLFRHDFMIDHIAHGQEQLAAVYREGRLLEQRPNAPLVHDHLIRLNYQPYLGFYCRPGQTTVTAWAQPCLQVRTAKRFDVRAHTNVWEDRAFGKGGYRVFGQYGVRCDLPEWWSTGCSSVAPSAVQPYLYWQYTPKFMVQHWYQMDDFDVIKPTNSVAVGLRTHLSCGASMWHLQAQQGYDGYRSIDRFPLSRGVSQRHLMPFRYSLDGSLASFFVHADQELEWRGPTLLQSYLAAGLLTNACTVSLGYLFTHRNLAAVRGLVNNVPHFIIAQASGPLSRYVSVAYHAYFSASKATEFFSWSGLSPLLHGIRVDFNGHCWGFSLGLEEKKYREYGTWRAERAIVFSFKLQSLGSFAQKFRQPFQHPLS